MYIDIGPFILKVVQVHFFFFFEKIKVYTKLSINYMIFHFLEKWTYTTFKINGPYSF